ncbi:MAG: cation:proton antiporter [Pyrinomonadaceae bacterium]
MEHINIEQVELILLIGAVVAIIARRLRIPYTVGLVAAGAAITLLPLGIQVPLSKEILFKLLLPPLIFEAALYIRWDELRRDLLPVATFATVGVLLSAGVTAAIMYYVVGWSLGAAVLFGVLIAATDPVSVIATFKEARVTGRLRLLVEAESLFNDSTAAVAFVVALAFAMAEPVSVGSAALLMGKSIAGGAVCGLVVGGGVLFIAGRTGDHLAELALTTIAAFGSFWLAEYFHLSGVLATMTAGLLVGNTSSFGFISQKGEDSIETFWEFAAFAANSVIFILLGVNEAYQDFAPVLIAIGVAIAAVIVARAIVIYPISAIYSRTGWKIDGAHQHVLFWGGLRGALALALALSIPDTYAHKQEIVLVTFGVVAFSVFVQGLTMTPVLRWLGQLPEPESGEVKR